MLIRSRSLAVRGYHLPTLNLDLLVYHYLSQITMLKQHYSENIEPTKFKHLLDSYKDEVPQKLAELEKHRLKIIPEALSERNATHLTKKEVQTLVDWKLYVIELVL